MVVAIMLAAAISGLSSRDCTNCRDGHATAVLAASIFHFGEHTVREAKAYMAKAGLPIRMDA